MTEVNERNNFQPHNMLMSKVLLQNAKQAYFRYKKVLDEKQKQKSKKSIGAFEIEKEIAGLNAQKSQLEIAIEEYKKEADKYAFEVKDMENPELLKLSNCLKYAFKEKQEELDECLKENGKLMLKSEFKSITLL